MPKVNPEWVRRIEDRYHRGYYTEDKGDIDSPMELEEENDEQDISEETQAEKS